MTDSDAAQVIQKLDEALNIIRRHDGQLSPVGVRTKTMIAIARSELAQELSDSCHDQQPGTELFKRPVTGNPFDSSLGAAG
jgi:hypothetical protein